MIIAPRAGDNAPLALFATPAPVAPVACPPKPSSSIPVMTCRQDRETGGGIRCRSCRRHSTRDLAANLAANLACKGPAAIEPSPLHIPVAPQAVNSSAPSTPCVPQPLHIPVCCAVAAVAGRASVDAAADAAAISANDLPVASHTQTQGGRPAGSFIPNSYFAEARIPGIPPRAPKALLAPFVPASTQIGFPPHDFDMCKFEWGNAHNTHIAARWSCASGTAGRRGARLTLCWESPSALLQPVPAFYLYPGYGAIGDSPAKLMLAREAHGWSGIGRSRARGAGCFKISSQRASALTARHSSSYIPCRRAGFFPDVCQTSVLNGRRASQGSLRFGRAWVFCLSGLVNAMLPRPIDAAIAR